MSCAVLCLIELVDFCMPNIFGAFYLRTHSFYLMTLNNDRYCRVVCRIWRLSLEKASKS